jgi:hypothetical protein
MSTTPALQATQSNADRTFIEIPRLGESAGLQDVANVTEIGSLLIAHCSLLGLQ